MKIRIYIYSVFITTNAVFFYAHINSVFKYQNWRERVIRLSCDNIFQAKYILLDLFWSANCCFRGGNPGKIKLITIKVKIHQYFSIDFAMSHKIRNVDIKMRHISQELCHKNFM